MPHSEALAAAAHLHVLLRRKTGRVTDTEWMASNVEYARAMVAFARACAEEDGHVDLLPLAARVETLMQLTEPARASRPPRDDPAVSTVDAVVADSIAPVPAPAGDSLSQRYIGRLR